MAGSSLTIGRMLEDLGFGREDLVLALELGVTDLYLAFSAATPTEEVARWRAAIARLNGQDRYRALYRSLFYEMPPPLEP